MFVERKCKEERTMLYEKPTLVVLAKAAEAIRGINKPSTDLDSCEHSTTSAYEADE